eukprot:gb/GEZN01001161.1/.p1 GENE.gb/GEZN01001161.1/~~gb/GEZN01001161.1/.p1  ORF type:complete len:665 (-),score=68.40 gb/GEZN01001161.1/:546-2540(-)
MHERGKRPGSSSTGVQRLSCHRVQSGLASSGVEWETRNFQLVQPGLVGQSKERSLYIASRPSVSIPSDTPKTQRAAAPPLLQGAAASPLPARPAPVGAAATTAKQRRPTTQQKQMDVSVATGGFGRNRVAHVVMHLHKNHKGPDLYDYDEQYKQQERLPMTSTFVSHEREENLRSNKDDADLDQPRVFFTDADLRVKTVSIWYSLRIVLMSTRIPHTQWSLGNVLFFVWYVGLNAVALAMSPIRPIDFKNGFGSLAAANTMMLIIPATRNSILTWFLGLPFDHVVLYHRLLGRIALACAVVHFGFYWKAFRASLSSFKYLTGFFAMLCGLIIFVTSVEWFRRSKFEVFYWAHFSFLGYFALAWFHVPQCKPFLAIGVGLYILDKFLRGLWTFLPSRMVLFANKGDSIAQVRFNKNPLTRFLGKHKVGQYYFVNFPNLSLTEWHPFSVSSGPRETDVELHIRALGDHTSLVVALAQKTALARQANQLVQNPWIRIDGPYGNLSFNIRRYSVLFLAGGGVGVTPVIGLLKDLFNGGKLPDGEKSVVRPHRIDEVYMTWVIPHATDYDVFRADIEECMALARRPQFPKLRVMVYATRAKPEEARPPIHTGRPKFNIIFDEMEQRHMNKAALVFACGPEPMVNELWDQSTRRSKAGARIDFHHETFNF